MEKKTPLNQMNYLTFAGVTNRRESLISDSAALLHPVTFIRTEKVKVHNVESTGIKRNNLSSVTNSRISPTSSSQNLQSRRSSNHDLSRTSPRGSKTEEILSASKHYINIATPAASPERYRKDSYGSIRMKMGSLPSPGGLFSPEITEIMSNSDGAKFFVGIPNRRRRGAFRKNSFNEGIQFHSESIINEGSRQVFCQGSIQRLISQENLLTVNEDRKYNDKIGIQPANVGTQDTSIHNDNKLKSNAFTDSWREDYKKFKLTERRRSSNNIAKNEQDIKVALFRRRHSSVVSLSLPEAILSSKTESGKLKNSSLSSRNTSSTSDDPHSLPRIKSRETPTISSKDSSQDSQHAYLKLPNLIQRSPLQKRIRVGYLSHQFLREMRKRKRSRRRIRTNSKLSSTSPPERFKRVARIVRLLLRCLTNYRTIAIVSKKSQMPFSMFSKNMTSTRIYPGGLEFDPDHYKATKERQVGTELRRIMTLSPSLRTDKEVDFALKSLRVLAEEFGEFPLRMQESLVRVTWLDEFETKRVIIRQGQPAENFYFIVTGTALVTKNRIDPKTGDLFVETVSVLKRGMSFGELAIIRREERNANVIANSPVALLTVGREDFIDIFMHRMDGEVPEFISFLRKTPEFSLFPLHEIPRNKPRICAFTYFRVGVVICNENTFSDVIVIVKSGVCKVLKALKPTKPDLMTFSTKDRIPTLYVPKQKKIQRSKGNNKNHYDVLILKYREWIAKHPVTMGTTRILAGDEEFIRQDVQEKPFADEVDGRVHDDKGNQLQQNSTIECNNPRQRNGNKNNVVYIHVQTLKEGDVFGILPLIFEPSEGATSMSLVSEGAECILINKNFFLKHLDAEMRESLVRMLRPYPTEEYLQEEMQRRTNWDEFKYLTVMAYAMKFDKKSLKRIDEEHRHPKRILA